MIRSQKNKGSRVYKKLLREIKRTLSMNSILQHIFSIILLFSLTYFILSIFKIDSLLITSVVAAAYFLYAAIKIREDWNILYIKYPRLADEIATFRDTINQSSEMIQKLREDTLKKIDRISNAEFIEYKPLFIKSIGIILFTLAILFTSSSNIYINMPKTLNMPEITAKISSLDLLNHQEEDKNSGNIKNDIPKITERDDELKINYNVEYDLSETTDPEDMDFIESDDQSNGASMDDIFIEHISKDEEEVIKRYFTQK